MNYKDCLTYCVYMMTIFPNPHFFIKLPGTVVVMIVWSLDLQLLVQSVPITTKVMSSNLALGEVHVIPFVSDLQQFCGFPWVLQFSPPIKLTAKI